MDEEIQNKQQINGVELKCWIYWGKGEVQVQLVEQMNVRYPMLSKEGKLYNFMRL